MKSFLMFAALLLCWGCSQEQIKNRVIYVSGKGEIQVVPDMAYLNVNASNVRQTAKQSYAATSESINALLEECAKLGIDKKDIKTSHISINKQFRWIKNTQTFIGYSSSAYLHITVKKLDILGELSEKILDTKTNEINGIEYDHSKYDSLYNEAGVVALKDAKAIAEKMAKEMGVGIGDILKISNEKVQNAEYEYGSGFGRDAVSMNAIVAKRAGVAHIEPGIIKISNISYLTYEIK